MSTAQAFDPPVERVKFVFAPRCRWSYLPARWLRRLEELGVLELDWGLFSLEVLHLSADDDPLTLQAVSGPALRTAIAIRDLQGALNNRAIPAFGAKKIGDVRRRDVQRLVDEMTPELSGSRVRSVVHAIHSLYRWAQTRELVYHDPAALVQLPAMDSRSRDRVATPQEMSALLAALKLADALPFALAAYATARRAEIRHIRVEDVDLDLGVIYLGADERGRKSKAARRAVPIAKPLRIMLRRSLLERGRPGPAELLCPARKPGGRNSGMLSFEGLQKRVDDTWEPKDEHGRPTGVKLAERITAHECRHTCATWLDAAGVRPVVVSRLMGHASPRRQEGAAQITQERYTHVLPGDLELAREQLDSFLLNEAQKRISN